MWFYIFLTIGVPGLVILNFFLHFWAPLETFSFALGFTMPVWCAAFAVGWFILTLGRFFRLHQLKSQNVPVKVISLQFQKWELSWQLEESLVAAAAQSRRTLSLSKGFSLMASGGLLFFLCVVLRSFQVPLVALVLVGGVYSLMTQNIALRLFDPENVLKAWLKKQASNIMSSLSLPQESLQKLRVLETRLQWKASSLGVEQFINLRKEIAAYTALQPGRVLQFAEKAGVKKLKKFLSQLIERAVFNLEQVENALNLSEEVQQLLNEVREQVLSAYQTSLFTELVELEAHFDRLTSGNLADTQSPFHEVVDGLKKELESLKQRLSLLKGRTNERLLASQGEERMRKE